MTNPTSSGPPPGRRFELVLIAAVARNGAIGLGNGLIFNERADQAHFRAATLGCPVLMGRKTWDSLPPRFRPLPGRRNVVLSRNPALQAPGAEVVSSLDAALQALGADAPARIFVIGGAQLYEQALPLADELLLTEVDADLDGDTFFPPWPRAGFKATRRTEATTADGVGYAFVTYRRV